MKLRTMLKFVARRTGAGWGLGGTPMGANTSPCLLTFPMLQNLLVCETIESLEKTQPEEEVWV